MRRILGMICLLVAFAPGVVSFTLGRSFIVPVVFRGVPVGLRQATFIGGHLVQDWEIWAAFFISTLGTAGLTIAGVVLLLSRLHEAA